MREKTQPRNSKPEGFPAEYYAALLPGFIHKLNNIITVLSGHSGLLLLETDLNENILRQVQQMSWAAQRLSRYIDEAAILCKVTPLSLETIEVSKMFESLIIPSNLSVTRRCDSRIKVLGDRRKLKNIFEQLFQNAREANAKSVMVTVDTHSEVVALRFRDDGHGIKREVMPRVFDPFFTTRKQQEQLGLGLFRARGELARMKGQISAESDGKTYTEIDVRLPAG